MIENGIKPICDVLNAIDGVTTEYSCEGHFFKHRLPYVMFRAPNNIAFKIHTCVFQQSSLKYNWILKAFFRDDGSFVFLLEPDDVRFDNLIFHPTFSRKKLDHELKQLSVIINEHINL